MKLRCFTSLIATMVMASTTGAAEIYNNNNGNTLNIFGNISGGQLYSKNSTNSGSHSFIRYGLTGTSEISDKFFGFSKWESEVSLQNVEEEINLKGSTHSLLGYVGIKFGDLGSIDYGRNYGILYDVSSWTDIIPEFGGSLSTPDNFLSNRASNVITYRNDNFFGLLNGLNFAAQYQIKNDINQYTGRTVKTANGIGYGVSLSYTLGNGISTAAVYANSQRTPAQKNLVDDYYSSNSSEGNTPATITRRVSSDFAEAYSFGLKYDAHGMYFAAVYGESYNMIPFGNFDDPLNPENVYGFINRAKNVEVIARYKFDFGLAPLISYTCSRASDVENGYGNYLKKYITIGTNFVFNKNVSTSLNYKFNLLSKSDFNTAAKICTDDLFALGVSYSF